MSAALMPGRDRDRHELRYRPNLRRRRLRFRPGELRVLSQDRLLEPPELLSDVDPVLGRQGLTSRLDRVQRLGLPTRAIQGERLEGVQVLTKWMALHQRSQLGD